MARGRPSKRQHIIQIARELFASCGYQGTSIDQVVAAAAVSKPTVYSNFPTKQALWCAVMEDLIHHTRQHFALPSAASELSALEQQLTLWQLWSADAYRQMAYRVFIGERHKLDDDAQALFTEFESVLRNFLRDVRRESMHAPLDGLAQLIDCLGYQSFLINALTGKTLPTVDEIYDYVQTMEAPLK